MNNDTIIIFDGTFDGFLTAVFDCFDKKIYPKTIEKSGSVQQQIGVDFFNISTDFKKAERVIKGIESKISKDVSDNVYLAFNNADNDNFAYILDYIRLAFKKGKKVDNYKTEDYVLNVLKNKQNVFGEAHLLSGFIRFKETVSGVLYSEISPKNDVLTLLAEHFSDRLKSEKWIIHDVSRKKAVIYNSQYWIMTDMTDNINITVSASEEDYQNLWIQFFNSVAISERKNNKLQTSMLPKRYRKHMTEFNKIQKG